MLANLEKENPGLRTSALAALMNVRPSHLLDAALWKKLGLEVAREEPEVAPLAASAPSSLGLTVARFLHGREGAVISWLLASTHGGSPLPGPCRKDSRLSVPAFALVAVVALVAGSLLTTSSPVAARVSSVWIFLGRRSWRGPS